MKMPRADEAVVPPAKISRYLLNLDHPAGRSKAFFFLGRGFKEGSHPILADQLLRLALEDCAGPVEFDAYGARFRIIGRIETPDGRGAKVLSAWMIGPGGPPRLLTAYPHQ